MYHLIFEKMYQKIAQHAFLRASMGLEFVKLVQWVRLSWVAFERNWVRHIFLTYQIPFDLAFGPALPPTGSACGLAVPPPFNSCI